MKSTDLRVKRKQFWESKKHVFLPEVSLVAEKDSTAMFNVAGMQQLIPYLAGKKHPLGTRLYNIQKCVRTVDIDEVGDATHLTMFEMMGNRSLGDYFKKESVERSYEFLTQHLGLDPKKLAVTVFVGDETAPRDTQTFEYRKEKGIPEERISFLGRADNRRSPGPVGPCGPDTEIFYRVGAEDFPPAGNNKENDDDNWMEIWNNVFMEFYGDNGTYTSLPQQNVDTGMGFERMCRVLQGTETIYETDIFSGVLQTIVEYTGQDVYPGFEKKQRDFTDRDKEIVRHMRIVADHTRSSSLLISDGVMPSNEGRGYVLRRLIRRMYYHLLALRVEGKHKLQQQDVFFHAVLENIQHVYSHLSLDIASIKNVLIKEIQQFQKTIDHGGKVFDEILAGSAKDRTLSGQNIFLLYDTYGFPVELTKEIAENKGYTVDIKGFEEQLAQAQEKSRQGSKGKFTKDVDRSIHIQGISPTKFVGYDTIQQENMKLLKDFSVGEQRILIFDTTPMYAESGGQTGDSGTLILDSGEKVYIKDVKKSAGVFLHFVN